MLEPGRYGTSCFKQVVLSCCFFVVSVNLYVLLNVSKELHCVFGSAEAGRSKVFSETAPSVGFDAAVARFDRVAMDVTDHAKKRLQ